MKSTIFKNRFSTLFLCFSITLSCLAISCSDDDTAVTPEDLYPEASLDVVVNIPFFVETAEGLLPSNPDDLLFDSKMHNPILAPDGHQLNWGEYSAVSGSISAACTEEGTYFNFRVSGLVPDGVYTVWNVDVKAPGFDPAAEMFNITGIGAAGKGDGTDNTFVAGPDGIAEISINSKGGPLSMFGEIGDCLLRDQFEWHVVGAYHIDGKTYGPNLGPDGTVVEQFGFVFRNQN